MAIENRTDEEMTMDNDKIARELLAAARELVSGGATFEERGGMSLAMKIEGASDPFRDGAIIKEFKSRAKRSWVGAKGKSTMAAVKRWVREMKPSQFYARWKSDSSSYKDDSVEIWYIE